jgi:hypothetical protein
MKNYNFTQNWFYSHDLELPYPDLSKYEIYTK